MIILDKGEIVESGMTAEIFSAPHHAVTKALIAASSSEERVRS
jgi:ABC-type oligopeptide transport system ATPase subunit